MLQSVSASPPIALAATPRRAGKTPQAAAADNSQQSAELNRLLSKYKTGLQQGMPASSLASLGRQIVADGKALGENVTLPKASANPAASATPEASTEASTPHAAPQDVATSRPGALNKLA